MSYILDALKKAEAQRTLGALPNIHTPAVFTAVLNDRAPLWRRAWRWGALTALVMILAALAWFRLGQIGTALPQTQPSLPAPAPLIAPALPPVRAPIATAPHKMGPPEASKPKARLALSLPQQRPTAAVTPRAPVQPPLPATGTPEPELQTLRDLPPQIQREIAPLVISGYIYSSNRAERSLLINNQLLREGDTVAPGLILEKMLRGTVVLNYQGYRYRMPY